MDILIVCIALLFYLAATTTLVRGLFQVEGVNFTRVHYLAGIAVAAHLVFVILQVFTPGGQDLSLINVVSIVCLVIVSTTSVATIKYPAPFLLTVVYGFAAFVQFSTLFFPHPLVVKSFLSNLPLAGHISLSLLAYCVLIIATLYAIQFQYISRKLKSKDMLVVSNNFPPLMQVEKQQFQLLMIGTVLLSLALLTGFVYLDNMFSKSIAHKTVLSLIAWGLYVALVVGHKIRGWRGKTAVLTTIIGAFLLTLAYFGSRFVREILLGRF